MLDRCLGASDLMDSLSTLLDLLEEPLPPLFRGQIHGRLAAALLQLGQFDDAISAWDNAKALMASSKIGTEILLKHFGHFK